MSGRIVLTKTSVFIDIFKVFPTVDNYYENVNKQKVAENVNMWNRNERWVMSVRYIFIFNEKLKYNNKYRLNRI